jgi:DNA-directed RNA polymerase subunit RPC12/RpoP
MNELKFSCPHCEQHLQCDEQASGREIQCPNCHHLIRVPPIPGRTAQYNPESGKTWASFVPSGNVSPPKGISLARKPDRPGRLETSQLNEPPQMNSGFYLAQARQK